MATHCAICGVVFIMGREGRMLGDGMLKNDSSFLLQALRRTKGTKKTEEIKSNSHVLDRFR